MSGFDMSSCENLCCISMKLDEPRPRSDMPGMPPIAPRPNGVPLVFVALKKKEKRGK